MKARLWYFVAASLFFAVDAVRLGSQAFHEVWFWLLGKSIRGLLGGADWLSRRGYGIGRWLLEKTNGVAHQGTQRALRCLERSAAHSERRARGAETSS